MKADASIPNEITHPDTGARMVLDTSQGSEVMRHRLERNIGIAQGGAEVLAKVRDKEQDEGYIYVDPLTGYKARLRIEDGRAVGGRREDGGAPSSRQGDQGDEDREAKRARLRAELAELEA